MRKKVSRGYKREAGVALATRRLDYTTDMDYKPEDRFCTMAAAAVWKTMSASSLR